MGNYPKMLARKPQYLSPKQMTIEGFETPFERHLKAGNRWVVLAKLIPWDEISNVYLKHVGISRTGRKPLNPRIVIGALIIKHMNDLDDRETIAQISENIYMQYFLGYSGFDPEPPFDPSLFVEIRNRLGAEQLNAINEKIIELKTKFETKAEATAKTEPTHKSENTKEAIIPGEKTEITITEKPQNKGRLLMDASVCPQDIAYPTDLNLLSESREKSEHLIDILYKPELHEKKPRTYRIGARKEYLKTAMKKNKPKKEIRRAIKKQLNYLRRNIASIDKLLDAYPTIPLNRTDYKYMLVIRTVYSQQLEMYQKRVHAIDDRIVSIHQPHVRPIVRGKEHANVEFGSKIHISTIEGITFLDEISWNAFNEGKHLKKFIEYFYRRFGFYPLEVLVDKIYCTRENRKYMKERGIKLIGKPLGRPSASAVTVHVSPGERNPVEGKFGQAKTAYGLDRIRARLKSTSESWIASIILVLNLVKLAGSVSYYLIFPSGNNISRILKMIFVSLSELKLSEKKFPASFYLNAEGV